MYMLQLFDTANELQPIDARLIRDGLMRIGRDSAADWSIADPDCELSRAHCELAVADGALTLRALGANGVFDDATGDALSRRGRGARCRSRSTLRFGRFRLKASHAPHGDEPVDAARTMVLTPPLGTSTAVPDDWSDASVDPARPPTDRCSRRSAKAPGSMRRCCRARTRPRSCAAPARSIARWCSASAT